MNNNNQPDLSQTVNGNPFLTWGKLKEMVELQAGMAWQLKQPMAANDFPLGSLERQWFTEKYLELSSTTTKKSPTRQKYYVEWDCIGIATFEVDTDKVTDDYLHQINSSFPDANGRLEDESEEANGLLNAVLKLLANLTLRHQLCHHNAVEHFQYGHCKSLLPLDGHTGLKLLEVDISGITFDDFNVRPSSQPV